MVEFEIIRRRMMSGKKEYIQFVDPEVERIAVANYSSDHIGVTLQDAAAVTTIGTKFYNNANIVSFDELQYFTGLTQIANMAFYNNSNMVSVVIPSNATLMGQRAFRGCVKLESVGDLSNIVTFSAQEQFYDCRELTGDIYMPSLQNWDDSGTFYNCKITSVSSLGSITRVAKQAFYNCKSLVTVVLPQTVTELPQWCFLNCTALTTVTIHAATPPTCDRPFQGCSALSAIYVPASSVSAYQSATYWSGYSSIIQAIS